MIKITTKPIDVQKVIDTASSLSAGAVNVYIGTVQNATRHKPLRWVEYEALESVAVAEIRNIINEASHRWRLSGWAVSQRIGTLRPGEVAIVVCVSATERQEAFDACEFIIDAVEAKAPIWKKEVLAGGEEWVPAPAYALAAL